MAKKPDSYWMHKKLFRDIGDMLTPNDLKRFKQAIPLEPRDREECGKSAEDLLESWQKRGGISLGNYAELLRLLRETDLMEILDKAKASIDEIMKQLEIENKIAASPAEWAPDPPSDDLDSGAGPSYVSQLELTYRQGFPEV